MTLGRALLSILVVVVSACDAMPELDVGPGESVTLGAGDSVNGDVTCQDGLLVVGPDVTINGDIEAQGCTLKIWASPNGDIVATGGALVSVQEARSINGALDVEGVDKVFVDNSQFNGELWIRGAREIVVADSYFNGDGVIEGALSAIVVGNDFNGDLSIDALDCVASDNGTNGTMIAPGCRAASEAP